MKTVVGMYRTVEEATNVKRALENEGYSGGDLTVMDQSESRTRDGVDRDATDDGSVGNKIKSFFSNLTGHDEDVHESYTQGVSQGGALVALRVSDDEVDRAASVLEAHGAQQVRGGEGAAYSRSAGSYGTEGNATGNYRGEEGEFGRGPVRDYDITDTHELGTGTTAAGRGSDLDAREFGSNKVGGRTDARGAVAGDQVIPVVAEEMNVGKRNVDRGGVRVYSHLVSEDVSQNVNLREERVSVEHRAVNRAATDADFRDAGPIEVRAMGEEAVVGKTGRVVEEVVVGKTATDRTETVRDSVRHTEVDVEPLEVETTGTSTGTKY